MDESRHFVHFLPPPPPVFAYFSLDFCPFFDLKMDISINCLILFLIFNSKESELMKVIQGGLKKGSWLQDREAYSDEEIAEVNQRLRQLINRYPKYRSFFELFLWDIKEDAKPKIRRVK